MTDTVKIKLVGAKRYMCELFGTDAVVEGGVVSVPEDKADIFLEETWTDGLGNKHAVWEDVTNAVPTPARRGAVKKAVPADTDGQQ